MTGREVGHSEPMEAGENKKAKITLLEPLPVVGEAEITRIGLGRAGGEMKTSDGQIWKLKITGFDK